MATLDAVVGYTFEAEQLCPNCTIEALKDQGLAQLHDPSDEATIRSLAELADIDYDDPYSYDSGDFPKPILGAQLDCGASEADDFDHERCGGCRTALCE